MTRSPIRKWQVPGESCLTGSSRPTTVGVALTGRSRGSQTTRAWREQPGIVAAGLRKLLLRLLVFHQVCSPADMAASGLDRQHSFPRCRRMLTGVERCPVLVETGGGLSEYVQFGEAMVPFIAILIGSYSFVLTSPGARENETRFERDR